MTSLRYLASPLTWKCWVTDFWICQQAGSPAMGNPLYEALDQDVAWAALDMKLIAEKEGVWA